MRSGRVRKKFVAPLLCVAALIAGSGLALAQSDDKNVDDKQADAAKRLNNSVYRVTILHNFFNRNLPTEKLVATAVLVKSPNLLLTTTLIGSDGRDVYDIYDYIDKNYPDYSKLMASVCEAEPDPVRLQNEREKVNKQFAEKKVEPEKEKSDLKRFKEVSESIDKAFKPATPAAAEEKSKKGSDEDKKGDEIQKYQARVESVKDIFASTSACVGFTVKKIDKTRNLVLLEALDPLNGAIPRFNSRNPVPGTGVQAYGFPVSTDAIQTRRASANDVRRARLVPSVLSSTVVKVNFDEIRAQDKGQRIMHQVLLSNGTYGGPLSNQCGQVLGLNLQPQNFIRLLTQDGSSALTGKNKGIIGPGTITVPTSDIHQAIGAEEINTFAQLNGITLDIGSDECLATAPAASLLSVNTVKDNLPIIAAAALSLLLAATALVFVMRRPQPGAPMAGGALTSPHEDGSLFEAGYRGLPPSHATEFGQVSVPVEPIETLTSIPPGGQTVEAVKPAALTNATVRVRLVPLTGEHTIELDGKKAAGGGVILGRDNQCDVVCDNSTVSKQHARLTVTANGKLQIDDLGSANGTWRGRQRIQRETVTNGDTIRFGSVEYRVEISGGSGASASETVFMTPSRSWVLSGFDENGGAIHWKLQPDVDTNGRQKDTSWIVGRTAERAVFVLADKSVSGEHAKIRFTPQRGLEICDLSSSNGTKADGRVVKDSFVGIDDANFLEFGARRLTLTKSYG